MQPRDNPKHVFSLCPTESLPTPEQTDHSASNKVTSITRRFILSLNTKNITYPIVLKLFI